MYLQEKRFEKGGGWTFEGIKKERGERGGRPQPSKKLVWGKR